MRSSILLTSALAAGAMAGPIERRKLVTEIDVVIETVTVYVTAGQVIPTQGSDAEASHHYGHQTSHKVSSAAPSSSSTPAPVATLEPSSVVPESTSVYVAPSSSSSSSVVYSVISTSAVPTTTATPTTTAVPSTTAVPTTTAAPSTTAAPTTSSTSQAPASSSAPSYGVTHVSGEVQATFSSGQDYQDSVLWHHNRARANHGASNLEWSSDCESAAATAAAYCDFEHHTVDGQGQNLFTLSGTAYNVTAGITDSWYKGEADIYNWWGEEPPHDTSNTASLDMETFEKYGHATQMLWKGTTHVGCVTIECGSKMTVGGVSSSMSKYTVCNYSPPGNYVGDFAKNVAAPGSSYQGYSWAD